MTWSKQQLLKMRRNIHAGAESLPDDDAAETPEIFPQWRAGTKYYLNSRVQDSGKLWKVLQPELVASELYPPGAPGTESLYAEVPKKGDGTKDRPIAYNGNMALEEGLYYVQYDVEYVCTRSTGIPVVAALADLVGLYVEVAV